jgi:hypothetical protein
VLPPRIVGVALGTLVSMTGCWVSMAVDAGAGPVPTVIAPESDPAVEVEALEPDPVEDPNDEDARPAASEWSSALTVEAELVEARSAPHCGTKKWVVVMRYKVRRVIEGNYVESDLYVAHQCPEMGLDLCKGDTSGARVRSFRAGEVHRMQLKLGRGSGSLTDKFAARELPRYRSKCGSLVSAGARGA